MSDTDKQNSDKPNSEAAVPWNETAPVWNCELTPVDNPITVGSFQTLSCIGETPISYEETPLKIEFQDANFDFSLYVLEWLTKDPNKITATVTSYKAGDFQNPVFVIKNGQGIFKVQNLSWTVQSVLEGQEEKPIPSYGPFGLQWPWWYWGGIVFLILLVLIFIYSKIKKVWDRKKLIEQLMSHATALTPYNQFNKDLRVQIRNWQQVEILKKVGETQKARQEIISSTEKIFRQYLMRELLIPTLEWSDAQIIAEIKKRHPEVYETSALEIMKIFREFEQVKKTEKAAKDFTLVDCEQIVQMIKRTGEKVFQSKKVDL